MCWNVVLFIIAKAFISVDFATCLFMPQPANSIFSKCVMQLIRNPAPHPPHPHLHHSGGHPGGPAGHLSHHTHSGQVHLSCQASYNLHWALTEKINIFYLNFYSFFCVSMCVKSRHTVVGSIAYFQYLRLLYKLHIYQYKLKSTEDPAENMKKYYISNLK